MLWKNHLFTLCKDHNWTFGINPWVLWCNCYAFKKRFLKITKANINLYSGVIPAPYEVRGKLRRESIIAFEAVLRLHAL